MSNLTENQKRNVEILRSQGDTDEQIAANLLLDVADVPKGKRAPKTEAVTPADFEK